MAGSVCSKTVSLIGFDSLNKLVRASVIMLVDVALSRFNDALANDTYALTSDLYRCTLQHQEPLEHSKNRCALRLFSVLQ